MKVGWFVALIFSFTSYISVLAYAYEVNHMWDLKYHWPKFSLVANSQNEEKQTLEAPWIHLAKQKRDTLHRAARASKYCEHFLKAVTK